MNPTQSVILTQLLSFALFWLAGDEAKRKSTNGLRRLAGKPPTATPSKEAGPSMTVGVASGWAVMFVTLIVFTDIEATSSLAVAFGWLILISIALAYGEDAFKNVSTVIGQPQARSNNPRL